MHHMMHMEHFEQGQRPDTDDRDRDCDQVNLITVHNQMEVQETQEPLVFTVRVDLEPQRCMLAGNSVPTVTRSMNLLRPLLKCTKVPSK